MTNVLGKWESICVLIRLYQSDVLVFGSWSDFIVIFSFTPALGVLLPHTPLAQETVEKATFKTSSALKTFSISNVLNCTSILKLIFVFYMFNSKPVTVLSEDSERALHSGDTPVCIQQPSC